jgi:hypothetical protein
MQFDSHAWIVLILNLTLILTVSWVGFRLLKNASCIVKYAPTYPISSQMTSPSPVHLQVKKYLVIRRMVKTESDDDSPYEPSWFCHLNYGGCSNAYFQFRLFPNTCYPCQYNR